MTACAVGAGAVSATLAVSIVLSCRNLHHNSLDSAFLCFDYGDTISATFLGAVALVEAVTVGAGRHGW